MEMLSASVQGFLSLTKFANQLTNFPTFLSKPTSHTYIFPALIMTTFKDVLGAKAGAEMEQYWPYMFLLLSVYLVMYQIGIWSLIYKAVKQIIVMAMMVVCCVLWYVLMSQHVAVIAQVSTTSVLTGTPPKVLYVHFHLKSPSFYLHFVFLIDTMC